MYKETNEYKYRIEVVKLNPEKVVVKREEIALLEALDAFRMESEYYDHAGYEVRMRRYHEAMTLD